MASQKTNTLNDFLEPRGGRVLLKGEVKYLDDFGKEISCTGFFLLEMFGGIILLTEGGQRKTILPSSVLEAAGSRSESGKLITISWLPKERLFTIVE